MSAWPTSARRFAALSCLACALDVTASNARASTLDAQGQLVFDSSALLTMSFESLSEAQQEGASWLAWSTGTPPVLTATAVTAADWTSMGTASGVVTLPTALQGTQALRVAVGSTVGLGLVDSSFFFSLTAERVSVDFWGLSMGAEPELDVVFSTDAQVGPTGFAHVVAVRTGRETSDGWAEYSTGPVDGFVFNAAPLSDIILTARVPTTDGTYALDSDDLAPGTTDQALDSSAYALIDAVEIVPAVGGPMFPHLCTQATVSTICGPLGECVFGTCVDGAAVWGAVPQSSDHRTDLVSRWAFVAEHLGGDRQMAANAPNVFTTTAVSALASETTAPGFWGGLNTLVTSLRDAHTGLGIAPSDGTLFAEGLEIPGAYSGLLDICLGLAEDDLPSGTGAPVYAVFWVAPESPVGPAFGGTPLAVGDMLTEVDGLSPDAWMNGVRPRFGYTLPTDPTSEPASRALIFADAMAKFASAVSFSSCASDGTCTTKQVAVGSLTSAILTTAEYASATSSSRFCTGRFTDSVSTWTPSDDESSVDVPQIETVGNITSVEFDGFEGAFVATSPSAPFPTWQTPMLEAVSMQTNILFDARLGHGGEPFLGSYLAHLIRGTSDPYFALAEPRGTWDVIDPSWLFDSSVATCVDESAGFCGWLSGTSDESLFASPPAGSFKVAWVNATDLSQNDITPRYLLGASNVQIFGPHPTSGAYGERVYIPAYVAGWALGKTQTLDTRFGSSFATAVAASWESGTGVPPDQVVLQHVSDMLAGNDTVLAAATAWLNQ
jgi:hypothetical protein